MSEQSTKPEEQVVGEIQEQPQATDTTPATVEVTTEQKPSDVEGEKPAAAESSAQDQEAPKEEAAAKVEEEEDEEDEAEEEEPEDGVPIVLVTGASGFIATHLIKQLLEQGRYHVRGSVRNKKREEKVRYINIGKKNSIFTRMQYNASGSTFVQH